MIYLEAMDPRVAPTSIHCSEKGWNAFPLSGTGGNEVRYKGG